MRACTKCGVVKALDMFARAKGYADGHQRQCRECVRLAKAQRDRENPAKRKAQDAAYRERNRERIREQGARYRASEKGRAVRIRQSAKTSENVARLDRWRKENPDKFRALARATAANRRARVIASGGIVTQDEIRNMFSEYAWLCAYCAETAETIDHVVALKNGGAHSIENLVPACSSCNSRKNATPLLVWMRRRFEIDSAR